MTFIATRDAPQLANYMVIGSVAVLIYPTLKDVSPLSILFLLSGLCFILSAGSLYLALEDIPNEPPAGEQIQFSKWHNISNLLFKMGFFLLISGILIIINAWVYQFIPDAPKFLKGWLLPK